MQKRDSLANKELRGGFISIFVYPFDRWCKYQRTKRSHANQITAWCGQWMAPGWRQVTHGRTKRSSHQAITLDSRFPPGCLPFLGRQRFKHPKLSFLPGCGPTNNTTSSNHQELCAETNYCGGSDHKQSPRVARLPQT